jgi:hypothetical protein
MSEDEWDKVCFSLSAGLHSAPLHFTPFGVASLGFQPPSTFRAQHSKSAFELRLQAPH